MPARGRNTRSDGAASAPIDFAQAKEPSGLQRPYLRRPDARLQGFHPCFLAFSLVGTWVVGRAIPPGWCSLVGWCVRGGRAGAGRRLPPRSGGPPAAPRPPAAGGAAGAAAPAAAFREGRRADLPEELSAVPPVRRDRTDAADDLRGSASLGAGDQAEGGGGRDAALPLRSRRRHPAAEERSAAEPAGIQTIARWVDSGAPLGNPADLPPPVTFPDPNKWAFADQFGPPDIVIARSRSRCRPGDRTSGGGRSCRPA